MAERRQLLIGFGLTFATLACYAQTLGHDFIGWDDHLYVTDNLEVRAGLTLHGLRWALTSNLGSNWHPLTWFSHMLDFQLFGMWGGGHHLTSLLFHLGSTLLLWRILRRFPDGEWRGALVAALFALHPLQVESVAWASERKDVLSAFFGICTLAAYLRYAARPSVARYLLVVVAFAASLMSKPMLVTLPFVLLLLDYWPLRRRAVAEKLPLLLMSLGVSVLAFHFQETTGAMHALPMGARLANAVCAYGHYLWKLLWPARLGFLYRRPEHWPVWQIVASCAALLAGTAAASRRRETLVGWLWFLGTLVPVIGLVQVGTQYAADRYTYFPSIGFFIAVVWALPLRALPSMAVLAALTVMTSIQVSYWEDSYVFFEHQASVDPENSIAQMMLGDELVRRGHPDQAEAHYVKALESRPDFADAHLSLAICLAHLGRFDEAWQHVVRALAADPEVLNGQEVAKALLEGSGWPPEEQARRRSQVHSR